MLVLVPSHSEPAQSREGRPRGFRYASHFGDELTVLFLNKVSHQSAVAF